MSRVYAVQLDYVLETTLVAVSVTLEAFFPDPSLELCKERRAGVIMEMKYSMFALHVSAVFSLHKNFPHHAKTGNQKLPASRSSLRCAT